MDVKELKKLFGNYTQFYLEYSEYQYGFGRGDKRGKGSNYFPVNGADCTKAKCLELFDPKTENLNWISDIFPNIEVLELKEKKSDKLLSLDGIEKLNNLKTLIISSQFDKQGILSLNKINSSIKELYLWYTIVDFSILNEKMNFIYLHESKILNFDKLQSLNCNYLKFYNVKDNDRTQTTIEDYSGPFNEYTF